MLRDLAIVCLAGCLACLPAGSAGCSAEEGAAGQAQARLSLGFPYQSHDLARPRQGFLLDFLTKAMIWLGPDRAFSAFPYQSRVLASPKQENL